MKDKKFVILAMVCFLVVIGFNPINSNARTLKIGHILSPESLQNKALIEVFKPYVEKESEGSLEIKVFPNEQLGHAPDEVEAVKMGVQEMFFGSQEWWEAFVPEIGVNSVIFLFDDKDHFQRWLNGHVLPELMPKLVEKANQRFINTRVPWKRGPFRVICSQKPIFTPDDLKGLRLRLWPARTIQKGWAGFGVEIHTIDFAEAYLALKQGVVEAITVPLGLVWPQKFTEVTKYVTELRQFEQIGMISINEKVWKELTPKEQNILMDGCDKAGQWFNERELANVNSVIENKLLKVHNAAYIKVNRAPFIKITHENVIPNLIKDGIVKEEWMNTVNKYREK
jgi:TRAP-type C4-dicarboxylate transport system substrate-binding protein